MGWKNLPLWLKGGIIGSIVYPIIYILLGAFTLVCANSISGRESAAICYPLAILPIIPVAIVGLIIFWGFGIKEFGTNFGDFNIPTTLVIWGFVGSIVIGFILGLFIGSILDMVKMVRTTKQQAEKEKNIVDLGAEKTAVLNVASNIGKILGSKLAVEPKKKDKDSK